ncbi:MAG: hypothetical protein U9N60_03295 [Thermodesulfobacteriota bacterium]|nr:hypothetical protein [Thermodesulfobacteriota bacterium]
MVPEEDEEEITVNVSVIEKNIYRAVREKFIQQIPLFKQILNFQYNTDPHTLITASKSRLTPNAENTITS